jgi:hypothetical protein
MDSINKKLEYILECSEINHKVEILKEHSLKDAHIYCKIHNLTGQQTGPSIEKYIKNKYNMLKINASSCCGDLSCNGINFEIKVSNGGKENNQFNYVQIRMNHNCEYILTAYYLSYENLHKNGELFIFRLNKENIKSLILKHGGYAHGTIGELGKITMDDLNDINNKKEYDIRPKYGDKCWKELLQFRVEDIIV